jgi:hypothetical protein
MARRRSLSSEFVWSDDAFAFGSTGSGHLKELLEQSFPSQHQWGAHKTSGGRNRLTIIRLLQSITCPGHRPSSLAIAYEILGFS